MSVIWLLMKQLLPSPRKRSVHLKQIKKCKVGVVYDTPLSITASVASRQSSSSRVGVDRRIELPGIFRELQALSES